MNKKITHECNELDSDAVIEYMKLNNYEGEVDGWWIRLEDYGDRVKINYCPFCGSKLDKC